MRRTREEAFCQLREEFPHVLERKGFDSNASAEALENTLKLERICDRLEKLEAQKTAERKAA